MTIGIDLKPPRRLEKALSLLKTYIPRQFERCKNAVLIDEHATLVGSYTPVVRHPTVRLPCGKFVLGLGDVVVLNDPIAGQGAAIAIQSSGIIRRKNSGAWKKPF